MKRFTTVSLSAPSPSSAALRFLAVTAPVGFARGDEYSPDAAG